MNIDLRINMLNILSDYYKKIFPFVCLCVVFDLRSVYSIVRLIAMHYKLLLNIDIRWKVLR